jgi:hypothetical protein
MKIPVDTICHADRVAHRFFGQVDVLNLVHDAGPLVEGTTGWVLRPDGTRIHIRLKGFWRDRRLADASCLVIVVDPLPVHPKDLEGCPVEWAR